MHGINYHECFKAASLWLNEISISSNDDSADETVAVETIDWPASPSSDINLSLTSIQDSDGSFEDLPIII